MSELVSEPVNFDNTEVAYRSMSNGQLLKEYYLYKVMSYPFLVKVGSVITEFLLNIKFPIRSLVKSTIYSQFCGGETIEETKGLIDKLKSQNIEVLLNYSVEGLNDSESYKATFDETIKAIKFSMTNSSIRAICIKFTGFASIDLWTKIQSGGKLDSNELNEYNQAKEYICQLCDEALKSDVQLYIDAEESWFQNAIDDLVEELMEKYNKTQAYVFNTYQLYRSDKYEYLQKCIEEAKSKGYILGAKIVRGAYVEKENDYAEENSKSSVINKTKELSDIEFDKAIALCVNNIDNVSISCATHNEDSSKKFALAIKANGIKNNHPHISAAQLLGMSDHITYNLSDIGVKSAKYVPYGPLKEVIPYLIRRAQENTSVKGQMGRELALLQKEKKRRGL